jgi:phage tail-like protein
MARMDPLNATMFALSILKGGQGTFRECSGLGSESEIIEHKASTSDGKIISYKIPGNLKWDTVVLKRGVTDDMAIWDWRKKVEEGDVTGARTDVTITLFNQAHDAVAEWTFDNAWPVKVSGPSLNAGDNSLAVEELHLAHEGMRRTK